MISEKSPWIASQTSTPGCCVCRPRHCPWLPAAPTLNIPPPLPAPLELSPQANRQKPPASWEGGEQRCFDSLFICGRRFKPDRPLELGMPGSEEEERARLRTAVPRENYGFGQEVVRWYQRQGLVPLPPKPAAAAEASSGGSSRQLKVLFMRRDSGGRQLLNAEALVRSCNAWRYQLPAGGEVSADCRQVRGLQSVVSARSVASCACAHVASAVASEGQPNSRSSSPHHSGNIGQPRATLGNLMLAHAMPWDD